MRRLGRVVHTSSSKSIIVKMEANTIPNIGEKVVDENLQPIGNISDIFGPSRTPYIAIKPKVNAPLKLSSTVLYVLSSKRRKK